MKFNRTLLGLLCFTVFLAVVHSESRQLQGACNTGYYFSGGGCVACPAGCSGCSSAVSCSGCYSGYYMSSFSCIRCTTGCYSCAGGTCSACNTGYVLTSSQTCQSSSTTNGSLGDGGIAGIVTGSICLCCCVCLVIYCCFCRQNNMQNGAQPSGIAGFFNKFFGRGGHPGNMMNDSHMHPPGYGGHPMGGPIGPNDINMNIPPGFGGGHPGHGNHFGHGNGHHGGGHHGGSPRGHGHGGFGF